MSAPVPSTSKTTFISKPTRRSASSDHDLDEERHSDDDDAIFEDLEAEIDDQFDLGGLRERRMLELKSQMEHAQRMRDSDYGRYTEYKAEKQLIAVTAKERRCVVHFFHPDFKRCKIMDSHLSKLATKHQETLFLKADVANVPFLVTKLGIKVLPCVVAFVDGVSRLKLVGFDDLPGGDNFTTASLEMGLLQNGVIAAEGDSKRQDLPAIPLSSSGQRKIRSGASRQDDSDDDL
ncbi:hypothetical protein OIO90_001258 [Microbotryomycetes sp. JL221]|nr:hypothetical protein OIO90_001258 [Microbotryomycetes sp. JL221]